MKYILKRKEQKQVMLRYYAKYHEKQIMSIQRRFISKLIKRRNLKLMRVYRRFDTLRNKTILRQNLKEIKQIHEYVVIERKNKYESLLKSMTNEILHNFGMTFMCNIF